MPNWIAASVIAGAVSIAALAIYLFFNLLSRRLENAETKSREQGRIEYANEVAKHNLDVQQQMDEAAQNAGSVGDNLRDGKF